MAEKRQSGGKGCLFWAGITFLVFCCLIAVAAGLLVLKAKGLRDRYTATEPAQIAAPVVPPNAAKQSADRYKDLKRAIEQGTARTVSFSADDLNALIAGAPEMAQVKGRARVDIRDNLLVCDTSMPLDGFPGMEGRFLNAEFDVDIRCEGGVPEIYVRDARVRGTRLPAQFLDAIRQTNFGLQLMQENADFREAMKTVDSLRIEDNRLLITTRKRK